MCRCVEVVGIALGVLGIGTAIMICALPMRKVSAFIGFNIITAQVVWEGLWMNCVTQSTGQMQCKVYDSLLALPPELQASRVMTIISVILGVLGVVTSIVSAKCTNCIKEPSKAKVGIMSGVLFILAGLLVLIPVCWTTNVICRDFYNPLLISTQRKEMGASLYLGWGAAVLLFIGGTMLCKRKKYKPTQTVYFAPRSSSACGQYNENVC